MMKDKRPNKNLLEEIDRLERISKNRGMAIVLAQEVIAKHEADYDANEIKWMNIVSGYKKENAHRLLLLREAEAKIERLRVVVRKVRDTKQICQFETTLQREAREALEDE